MLSPGHLWRRGAAVLMIALGTLALVGARQLTSPTAAGYRVAMAAAPGGGLYLADSGRLLLLRPDGSTSTLSALPGPALALAADAGTVLLGTDSGLYRSLDSARTWRRAPVAGGRFLALAVSGRRLLAGAWAGSLWQSDDGGATWRAASIPAGDDEFESIAISPTADLAATETGMLTSTDGGATWARQPGLPGRMTAVEALGPRGYLAADWRGGVFKSRDGRAWSGAGRLGAGVWALAGGFAATTSGLYDLARQAWVGAPFRGLEVTALAAGGGEVYAAAARGPVYAGGHAGWRPLT